MKDAELNDLKQFITATVSQSESRLETRLETKIDTRLTTLETKLTKEIAGLRQEMRDGFTGVGEAIETIHVLMVHDKAEIDTRLSRLEAKAS